MIKFLKTDSILKRRLWLVMLAAYFFVLLYFTVFAESMGRSAGSSEPGYNLVLFTEISRFWTYRKQLGMWACFLNIFGNILAFMPWGYMFPEVSRSRRGFVEAMTAGFMLSFIIECTQFVFAVGSFDVDDLLLNTTGASLGYMLWYAVRLCTGSTAAAQSVIIREISLED